jgi:hypothetical protein
MERDKVGQEPRQESSVRSQRPPRTNKACDQCSLRKIKVRLHHRITAMSKFNSNLFTFSIVQANQPSTRQNVSGLLSERARLHSTQGMIETQLYHDVFFFTMILIKLLPNFQVTKKRPVNLAKLARPKSRSPVSQSGSQIDSTSGHSLAAQDAVLPSRDISDGVRREVPRWAVGQALEVPHASQIFSPQTIIQSIPRHSESSIMHGSQQSPSGSSSQAPNGPQDGYPLPSSDNWNHLGFMDDINLFASFIDFEVSKMCRFGALNNRCLPSR